MPNILEKYRIEFVALLSGLISTIASSTGYFYGDAASYYGPFATLFLAYIWIFFFGIILFNNSKVRANRSKSKQERDKEKIEHELLDQWNLKEHKEQQEIKEPSFYFLAIPWFFSLLCWTTGVYVHMTKERQKVISGFVTYGRHQKFHLPNAKLRISYANKDMYITANNIGYFRYEVDLQHNFNILLINIEENTKNLLPTTTVINLKEKSNKNSLRKKADTDISIMYEVQ